MKKFLTLTLVLFLSIEITHASLFKDLYTKYVDGIGYKDLIVGLSPDSIDENCQEYSSEEIAWVTHRCYDNKRWGFQFEIYRNKIEVFAMVDLLRTYKDESEFKLLLDELDKKYGLTEVEDYPDWEKIWYFKQGQVVLVYYATYPLSTRGRDNIRIIYGAEPTSDYSGF